MDLGEKIKDLRTRNDLTLEELGNIIGVGKSTIRKWENGTIANMRRDKIKKVADALGTTPAYLMGWEDETINIGNVTNPLFSQEELQLIDNYRSFNYEGQKKVTEYISDLATMNKYIKIHGETRGLLKSEKYKYEFSSDEKGTL